MFWWWLLKASEQELWRSVDLSQLPHGPEEQVIGLQTQALPYQEKPNKTSQTRFSSAIHDWAKNLKVNCENIAIEWTITRLNGEDGLGGIFPAMVNSLMALKIFDQDLCLEFFQNKNMLLDKLHMVVVYDLDLVLQTYSNLRSLHHTH